MPRAATGIAALLAALAALLGVGHLAALPMSPPVASGESSPLVNIGEPVNWPSALPVPQCLTGGTYPYSRPIAFADALHGWMEVQICSGGELRPTLAATTDGGQTWQPVEHPGVPGTLRFISPQDGWLLGESTMLVTRDGGATWAVDDQLHDVMALEAVDESVWAIEGHCESHDQCSRVFLVSDDFGHTWQPAPTQPVLPGYGARLVRAGLQDAWISTGGGELPKYLFGTHDGGTTWHELTVPCQNWNTQLAAVDASHLWFLCGSLPGGRTELKWLYASADGGTEWQLVRETGRGGLADLGNLPTVGHWVSFVATSPTRAFVGLYGDSLLVTTDGGQTWDCAVVPDGPDSELGILQVVFADEQHGWATTSTALWRTRDGGDSWERLAP